MPAKLYVSDLDGTLLQDDATLSAHCRRSLLDLLDRDVPFTVASARSLSSMRHILQGIPLRLPIIEFNGAFLSDLATGEHLWVNDLRQPTLGRVFETLCSHGHTPFVSTFDGDQDWLYAPPATHAGMQWYIDDRLAVSDRRMRQVQDVTVGLRERVVCLTIIDRAAALAPLREQLHVFGDAIDVNYWDNSYSPGWQWISVHDGRATKDQAVAALIEHAGLGDVEITAFGDQANDIGMVRAAHRGIAVGNAIAEVVAVADEVIGPNSSDSVVRYIDQDWSARG